MTSGDSKVNQHEGSRSMERQGSLRSTQQPVGLRDRRGEVDSSSRF